VLPRRTGEINELGIAFYDNIINTCIHYNLTPVATLYHFDMPAVLQNKYGGWLGEQIVDDFEEYARIVYSRFGDRVKHWFTINEREYSSRAQALQMLTYTVALVECAYHYPKTKGYFKNVLIPDVEQPFHCGRNILLAHARAYRLGKSIIPDSLITHKASGGYKIPLTNSTVDEQATQRAWDFEEGVRDYASLLLLIPC
jgi:beta-glucosidase/6-phospho-beta-glucosidase/beta-galactosidase